MSTELDRTEHAKARGGMLTSSMAETVLKGNTKAWNTLLDEIWDPRTAIEAFDQEVGGARGHGHRYEPVAAATFWTENPEWELEPSRFLRFHDPKSPFYPWVGGSPDNLIHQVTHRTKEVLEAGLEIKCPFKLSRWETYQRLYKQDPGTIPHMHRAQVQWLLWISNRTSWHLYVYWHITKEKLHWIEYPDPYVHEQFEKNVKRFIPHLEDGRPFEEMPMADVLNQL